MPQVGFSSKSRTRSTGDIADILIGEFVEKEDAFSRIFLP